MVQLFIAFITLAGAIWSSRNNVIKRIYDGLEAETRKSQAEPQMKDLNNQKMSLIFPC